jgi:hypothetical protein
MGYLDCLYADVFFYVVQRKCAMNTNKRWKYSFYHYISSVLLGMYIVIKAIYGTTQQVQGCKSMVSCDL